MTSCGSDNRIDPNDGAGSTPGWRRVRAEHAPGYKSAPGPGRRTGLRVSDLASHVLGDLGRASWTWQVEATELTRS